MKKETDDILAIPNGARFYRCALQVNPNDYAVYRGQEPDPDATAYAQRLIDEAVKHGIKILAITLEAERTSARHPASARQSRRA